MVAFFRSESWVTRPVGSGVSVGAEVSVGSAGAVVGVGASWVATGVAPPQAMQATMIMVLIMNIGLALFLHICISSINMYLWINPIGLLYFCIFSVPYL
jgi:hypothetical protein